MLQRTSVCYVVVLAAVCQGLSVVTPRLTSSLRKGIIRHMSEEGGVKYDVGSSWKPQEGGMQSTDTPDFFYEDGDERNTNIEYTDGMMGSTGLDKLRKQSASDPGIAGALEVDPTRIGGYQAESAAAKGVTFELDVPAKMGSFTQEINVEMAAGSSDAKVETVFVKPVAMSYEDYYAGFTDDTPPIFSVTPVEGRMERRGGAPTELSVSIRPDGQPGDKTGYLVVVLPEENEQFNIKINVKAF
mmetsp:Transcript_17306/g.52652  ORF Transcript_17306/g.52652 Transcript_17306/m.52652 type:complete len:243 (-) Transcript_17306:1002-1730(-)